MQLVLASTNNCRNVDLPELGDMMLGVYGASSYEWTIDTPVNQEFVATWKAEYGREPDMVDYLAYDTMNIYLAAVEALKL